MKITIVILMALIVIAAFPRATMACVEKNLITTDAPTIFVHNTTWKNTEISNILVYLAGFNWAKGPSAIENRINLSYRLDTSAPTSFALDEGRRLVLWTSTLAPGMHQISIALNVGGKLTQKETYCFRIP